MIISDFRYTGRVLDNLNQGMGLFKAMIQAHKDEIECLLSEGEITQNEARAVLDWLDKLESL